MQRKALEQYNNRKSVFESTFIRFRTSSFCDLSRLESYKARNEKIDVRGAKPKPTGDCFPALISASVCNLVPVTFSRARHKLRSPALGTSYVFPRLVPVTLSRAWHQLRFPALGTSYVFPRLVPVTFSRAWHQLHFPALGASWLTNVARLCSEFSLVHNTYALAIGSVSTQGELLKTCCTQLQTFKEGWLPFPNVTAATKVLRSGLTADEVLAAEREKSRTCQPLNNFTIK